MSDCTCDDWKDNLPKIEGPLVLQQVRSGATSDFKGFVFCPWCGSRLGAASQPTKAHGLDCQQYEDGSAPCTCGATPQPTAAHVHSFTMGVCACGERSDAYLYY